MSDHESERPQPIVIQDWLLALYVRLANDKGHNLGITLHLGGLVVSGVLIGWREYMLGITDLELAAFDDPAELEAFKETLGEPPQPIDEDFADEDEDDPAPVHFIHLQDARVYSASGVIPRNRGTYWRGRLSAVDGFTLGALTAE